MTDAGSDTPPKTRRRRWWLWSLFGIALIAVLLALSVGGLYWRLSVGPLSLPVSVQDRIEAELDQSMMLNQVDVGDVSVSLENGVDPEITLRDVTLSDADGAARAAFPELQVTLSPSALLRGDVHPVRVEIAGAGLVLSRDEDGVLDFEFTQGLEGVALSLPETLGRIDAMFAAPAFSELEEVVGTDLNLAMADGMTAQVIRVRDATMRLDRKGDAITLTIGGALEGSRDATIDLAVTREASLERTTLGVSFTNLAARDVATAAPALAWLDLMRAPISGRLVASLGDDGVIGNLSGQLDIGTGQFQVEGVDAPLNFNRMQAAFTFDAATGRMAFDLLEVEASELSFVAEGHADVSDDGTVYVGQFRLSALQADPRDFFPAPLEFDGAVVDLRLNLAPNLTLEIGQAAIFDGDLRAYASALIRSGPEGVNLSLDARIDEIMADAVLPYWPEEAIPRTRRWMVENVNHARLTGVDFALRWPPDTEPRVAVQFDFDRGDVRAVRSLPPVRNAEGYVTFHDRRLVVGMHRGAMTAPGGGDVRVDGSTMLVPRTGPGGPIAELDVDIAGAMTDVLRLLAEPPVNMFVEGPMTPVDIGQGQARLSAQVQTRLMRNVPREDLIFAVEGTITDYSSDRLVPDRTLAADRLQVSATANSVRVQGQATLDGVPLNGQWSRAIGPEAEPRSLVEARVQLDRDNLTTLGVPLPPWLISGQAEADVTLALVRDEPPALTLRSDLTGLGLSVPALGWRLPQSRSGDLVVEGTLGPTAAISRLDLSAAGLTLNGRVNLSGGRFDRLRADRLAVGRWLDVSGNLISTGIGRPPRIEVTGGALDLRDAPVGRDANAGSGGGAGGGAGNGAETGAPVTVNLDRLQVTDGIALRALQADLTSAGGLSGQFSGRINGDAPVTGTLITTPAGPAVRVRAQDGGAVLRSAGLLQSVHGGSLELIIGATTTPGVYEGQLDMEGPRLRDAPAMAELLNVISVVGLLEQLGNEGINLGDVDARFQIRPAQIILSQSTAVGPSIGLSMDGAYSIPDRRLDMQGVVSPLYIVNGMFGAIFAPRREGLFGFSYRLTGTPENTNVSVNPLSILTPGIFREIFRRPPPEPVDPE